MPECLVSRVRVGCALLALLITPVGCGDDDVVTPLPPDARVNPDGPVTPDAEPMPDAVPMPDGPPAPDAPFPIDADTTDAPFPIDAAPIDAPFPIDAPVDAPFPIDADTTDADTTDADTTDGPLPPADAAFPIDADMTPDAAWDGCTVPIALTPGTVAGDSSGALSFQSPNTTSPCAGAGGLAPEKVYTFVKTAARADIVWTVDATFDGLAYIRRSDCDAMTSGGTELADPYCDNEPGAGNIDEAVWMDAPSGTYYLFVDGSDAADQGTYDATLTLRAINGLGGACNGVTARCDDALGLVCAAGTCQEPVAACQALAPALTLGSTFAGDTTGDGDDQSCGGTGTAADEIWELTADATGGTYNVHVTSSHNVYLYASSNCYDPAASSICTGGLSGDVNFDVVLGASGFTFVVVDGFGTVAGTYSITADEVKLLAPGATCDPTRPLIDRCQGGTGCSPTTMTCVTVCGNGLLDEAAGEQCDDGGTTPGDGCSATCLHEITWASVTESEPNGTPMTADPTPGTALVTGNRTASDWDYYSVTLSAGDILTVATRDGATDHCLDGTLDSSIRIYGTDGVSDLSVGQTTRDNLSATNKCSSAYLFAPTAGTYYVAVTGPASNPVFDYTLSIVRTTPAYAAESEAEPNETSAAATAVADITLIDADLAMETDVDYYAVTVPAGYQLLVEVLDGPSDTCSPLDIDTRVRVYAPMGATLLSENDDISLMANRCSRTRAVTTQVGTYFIAVDKTPKFGTFMAFTYTLRVVALPQ